MRIVISSKTYTETVMSERDYLKVQLYASPGGHYRMGHQHHPGYVKTTPVAPPGFRDKGLILHSLEAYQDVETGLLVLDVEAFEKWIEGKKND